MRETPIGPRRRRLIEDMTVRNFGAKTRPDDIRHVKTFTAFLGQSPDRATPEDLRRFQLHPTETGMRPPTINGAVAAPRFFFSVTLDRPDLARHLTVVREPRRIPVGLSPEEVARLLEAAPGPKSKAALSAAYGAGLRVAEVVAPKVSDSTRMLLRVTFRYKDYRRNGQERSRTMTLTPNEFIRRFLLHVLPKGFHRIRHSGLLASAARQANLARARELLAAPEPPTLRDQTTSAAAAPNDQRPPCPCCGGRMIIVETFERGGGPRDPPPSEPGVRTAAA